MRKKLLDLQEQIFKYYDEEFKSYDRYENSLSLRYFPKLFFFQIGEFFEIKYYGSGDDFDPTKKAINFGADLNFGFCAVLDFICEEENADKIVSISFDGPDEGANGTNSWDFTRIINSRIMFPNLKEFKVKLTDLADHNQTIIDGKMYSENGFIAKLISKMPQLETLVIPSAPDQTFFQIGKHPLKELILQVGYSHENFLENFASSSNFDSLLILDYAETLNPTDVPGQNYSSFETFKKLFQSKSFSKVKQFILRNSILRLEELFELQKLNPVQFLYVKSEEGTYVSHLMKKQK